MSDLEDLYKIGTVAKLTGIAVERLRAWERRYGLTPASREGKTRFFSGEQVERLTRIRRLIDQGHPVSTLINLDSDTLNERLQSVQESKPAASDSATPNVVLVGTQLLMLEQNQPQVPRFKVAGRWVNLAVCLPELQATETAPDVVVVLLGSVTPASLSELQAIPAPSRTLVVYHYATDTGLAAAAEQGCELLRWPVSWTDIEAAVARLARSPLRAGRQASRHFSDEQLLTIASSGSGLGCACPADLVNLISALNAFSDHSAVCAEREPAHTAASAAEPPISEQPNSRRAAAPLAGTRHPETSGGRHAQIAERTSQARLELELVLDDWVRAEGLLPAPN